MFRSQGLSNISRTLRIPNYRKFIIGKFIGQVTMWMYRMAIGWLVWNMTHSATWLGIIIFLDNAPAIFVSPWAGTLADRVDRLKFLRITQALLLLHAAALSALIMLDLITIGYIAGLTLYFGCVTAAQIPASQAVVPNLVTRETLTSAYGLNSLIMNMSRFIGPPIAGVIIVNWGVGEAIAMNVVGIVTFSVCLAMLKVEIREGRKSGEGGGMFKDFRAGLSYARGHAGIGPMFVLLTMLATLTFPLIQLMPSFADGVFHAGPNGLAWMLSVFSVGAMIQGGFLAQRGAIRGLTNFVLGNILVVGAGMVLLTLTDKFWFGLIAVFIAGFATSGMKVASLTLIQYAVHGDMRGRIASFFATIHHGGPAIGALILGAMGDLIGIRPTIAMAGCLTLGIFLWAYRHKKTMSPALETEDLTPLRRDTEAAASAAKEDKPRAAQ